MAGEHGKNREIDFAYWANLDEKCVLSDAESEALLNMLGFHRYQNGLSDSDAKQTALVQCEILYRVSCLLAYGNGLAGYCDIQKFAKVADAPISVDASDPNGFEGDSMLRIEVTLPYSKWFDDARIPDALSTPREHHGVLNPGTASYLYVEHGFCADDGYQTFEMFCYPDMKVAKLGAMKEWREPFKIIGQVIANAHTFNNYVGTYDGKSMFDAKCGFDSLWQAIAELADKQAPGICPVCGKVVDRRRDERGGHPKKTCSAHSDKFHNMKKKLQAQMLEAKNRENARRGKEGLPRLSINVGDSVMLEEIVRQQRWQDTSLNERPLGFLGKAVAMRR